MPLTDLKLFADGASTLDPDAFAPDGLTGPDKVAARFVYFLLNTDVSPFLAALRQFRGDFDIFAAYASALPAAQTACRAAEETTDPDSDKFGSAQLLGVELTGDAATMTVLVKAADGTAAAPTEFVLEL